MSPKNPQEIPEVINKVASYLDDKDLASCARVSKNWRDVILPHLWRVVRVGQSDIDWIGPHPDTMYRYSHLIRELTLSVAFDGFNNHQYPNLRKLTIDFRDFNEYSNVYSYIHEYSGDAGSLDLEMFPSLIELNLMYVVVAPITWMTLAAHHQIKSLWLLNIEVGADEAPMLWKACGNLESLQMHSVIIQQSGKIQQGLDFHKLHTLHLVSVLGMDSTAQIDLILRSRGLKVLEWYADDIWFDGQSTLIEQPLQNAHWPHVHDLFIGSVIQDGDVASMLRAVGSGLERLAISNCYVETQASQALGLHFSNLVTLDFSSCLSAISPAVRDALCHCPKLEVLVAGTVFAKDIAEGGPWACLQLQRLHVCFWIGESEQDLQPLIFGRLSALVRLCNLTMSCPIERGNDGGVLEFRLDKGMGHLATLQQLSWICFEKMPFEDVLYMPQIGMEEVEWMVDNWKNLRKITGFLNSNRELEDQLRDVISSHGISVSSRAFTW
ncbi:hypothetical protein BGX34_005003 [Mortierella sp. NVP85]|nr:hypothetical protein BGX34_005003 [Mortierella sp. NVP85]